MKVVADSSVLISLSALDLLRKRFSEVTIPQAVQEEVVIEGTGQPGSQEVQSSNWIRVQEVQDRVFVQLLEAELDQGESEAIALARELNADLVLLDEKDARSKARQIGLRILGTIAILVWANKAGHIGSLQEQLNALRDKAKFRISMYRKRASNLELLFPVKR